MGTFRIQRSGEDGKLGTALSLLNYIHLQRFNSQNLVTERYPYESIVGLKKFLTNI